MNDIDKKLEQVLNLEPASPQPAPNTAVMVHQAKTALSDTNKLMDTDKVRDDFEYVREKMRAAIELGSEAMVELLTLSKTSQGFEHFTAFASLMKSLNETNRNLLELHKDALEVEMTSSPDGGSEPELDPNVIIGTQRAVMQMIRDQLGVSRGLEAANQIIILKADDPGLQN